MEHQVPQMRGCSNWHSAWISRWDNNFNLSNPYWVRGTKQLFAYYERSNGYTFNSRAAIVCGEGF